MQRLSKPCHLSLKKCLRSFGLRIIRRATAQYAKWRFLVKSIIIAPALSSPSGLRFLELQTLVETFLSERFSRNQNTARAAASQLQNVLSRCDQITYEEEGTAEAYALFHFMDRYHRFQIIFEKLHALELMPTRKQRDIAILDIGTGPGPSMFALSDFYGGMLGTPISREKRWEKPGFTIDYVEKSQAFRNWLHHFTEYANSRCPSGRLWMVPFHHGTYRDFSDIKLSYKHHQAARGNNEIVYSRREKYGRSFDFIVLSNFLTTREQVESFSEELKHCARYLRHNGIMLVVGSPDNSSKYRKVYEAIDELLVNTDYSSHMVDASIHAVDIDNSAMNFSWGGAYGERLKISLGNLYKELLVNNCELIDVALKDKIENSIHPSYDKEIKWQVRVFKKKSCRRPKKSGC